MGGGYNLHTYAPGIHVSICYHRSLQPLYSGLRTKHQHGSALGAGMPQKSIPAPQAGNHQQRSRRPFYQQGIY